MYEVKVYCATVLPFIMDNEHLRCSKKLRKFLYFMSKLKKMKRPQQVQVPKLSKGIHLPIVCSHEALAPYSSITYHKENTGMIKVKIA